MVSSFMMDFDSMLYDQKIFLFYKIASPIKTCPCSNQIAPGHYENKNASNPMIFSSCQLSHFVSELKDFPVCS
jgi:hypothetical protein